MDSSEWRLMLDGMAEDAKQMPPAGPLWTDDFSSLFEVLNTD